MMLAFAEGTVPDTVTDLGSLIVTLAAVAGIVWGVVARATKPIRDRLDDIKDLTESLRLERERVDDLSGRIDGLERRVSAVERRVEDVYHLLVSIMASLRGHRLDFPPDLHPPGDDSP